MIPEADAIDLMGNYDPALDDREAHVLANCLANGVDPTMAFNNGFNTFSTEVAQGGALDLDPEADRPNPGRPVSPGISRLRTRSICQSAPRTTKIDIKNTIIDPSGQFIVNDCYNSLTGNSVFCQRITRDLSDPAFPVIDIIDAGFLNRDKESARGVDINIAYDDTFTVFDRPIDLGVDIVANRNFERSTLFIDDNGNADFNEFQGEWGFPHWRGNIFVRFDYSDFRLTWETRYLSGVNQDASGVDVFDQAITGGSDTCIGPPSDVLCRDYGDTDGYMQHNLSFYYYGDRWTVGGGIRNVSDANPPVVDGTEVFSLNNTPIGYGYDINGRTYFFNVAVNFAGGQ